MFVLYQGSGSGDFELGPPTLARADEERILTNAARLLIARRSTEAAAMLRDHPWRIVRGENEFGDDFSVLVAHLPIDGYEALRPAVDDAIRRRMFRDIADVISEIGPFIRFVAVELQLTAPTSLTPEERERALRPSEVSGIVYNYIGVQGGYLGDFSYRSHHQFYVDLGLDINPYDYEGTTRERFTRILQESAPSVQAQILEGVLTRFPPGSSELRTPEAAARIQSLIERLTGPRPVSPPQLSITSATVARALADAEHLIATAGAQSAVDRVHTALHGYLRCLCNESGISFTEDARIGALLALLRDRHPAFAEPTHRGQDVRAILRAMGSIADALNPLRNRASVAHPNEALLDPPEAMLVVNVARSLLHYLDSKITAAAAAPTG